jgi:hypothetical protein
MSDHRVAFPKNETDLRQIFTFDRIPVEDLVGDARDPNNPNYYLYALMRSIRLESFFDTSRLRNFFECWRDSV